MRILDESNNPLQLENKAQIDNKAKKKWFIIASGPSLTKEDVERVRGQNVIAINDNYKLAPWADVLYACDPNWWRWHIDDVKSFKGKKYRQDKSWTDKDVEVIKDLDVQCIKSISESGLSTNPNVIHDGCNSGIQAINLAYHLGARKIILLGYDQQATDGKAHWFGHHPNEIVSDWYKWKGHYQLVADQAPDIGLEIINCTRETALTCFPIKKLKEMLDI